MIGGLRECLTGSCQVSRQCQPFTDYAIDRRSWDRLGYPGRDSQRLGDITSLHKHDCNFGKNRISLDAGRGVGRFTKDLRDERLVDSGS